MLVCDTDQSQSVKNQEAICWNIEVSGESLGVMSRTCFDDFCIYLFHSLLALFVL